MLLVRDAGVCHVENVAGGEVGGVFQRHSVPFPPREVQEVVAAHGLTLPPNHDTGDAGMVSPPFGIQ